MNYHKITTCDMKNYEGLRVVLWVSGCNHHCPYCHNPQTHDPLSGIPFTDEAREEILSELSKDWCSGLTISGGDPLYPDNRPTILELVKLVKSRIPNKTICLYTGYTYDQVADDPILDFIDILIDGEFLISEKDPTLKWRGSRNQKIIDLHSIRKEKL